MKIKKVEIEAFRAYKSKSDGTFDFTNDDEKPASFVAIYAPNGFGKSSFYDAVEWAITNHLERLGGEYNKANNKSAAKSSKNPDETLSILRNKYSDKTAITKVVVSTTKPIPFERELPKLTKVQMDMRIGDYKDRENEYFRGVILSQDAIDRFLREERPEERYSQFMESFDGDIETARKELSALINDNESELTALKKKKKSLNNELKQPIDLSVFEKFNSVATELNSLDEHIILPDEKFSSQSEHQLNASLISRKHELKTAFQVNKKTLEILSERLNKIPEIDLHARNLTDQKNKLTKLIKGVADAGKYQGLLDSYNKCVEDQKQANSRLNRLIEIAESAEFFLQTESRLKDITKNKNTLTEDNSKLNAELAAFQRNLEELNQESTTDNDRVSLLKNAKDNSDSVYAEISNNKKQLDDLNQKIIDKKNEIQIDKNSQERLNSELNKLSALKITTALLLSGNMGAMPFEHEKIEQLAKCQTDLNLLEVHKQALYTTQKALTEQMESHEKLISIGLNYLSVEPSHICPLCTYPHPSAGVLVDKIKKQNLLSEVTNENAKQLSLSSIREKELKDIIQTITQQVIESQAQQLFTLRDQLSEIEMKLATAEKDKYVFEAKCKNLENKKIELEKLVWSLSSHELVTRIEAELTQLSVKRPNLTQQQENLVAQIQVVNDSLKAKRIEFSTLQSEMNAKKSADVYISVITYLNENAVGAQDINNHCKMKKNELEGIAKDYRTSCDSLIAKCKELQFEMTADGTWIDFSLLKQEKESLESSIVSSQTTVNVFYESLSKIINIRFEDTLEQVKELIIAKTEEIQLHVHDQEKILNGVNLLLELMASFKPYIERISAQKALDTLNTQLIQRNQVKEVLVAERAVIIEKLEVLINNFFSEDLINSIYKKIDPHPSFKKVEFKVSFDTEKPTLNILVSDDAGHMISPILYFSAAQTNILSLSVFLANALHAKDHENNPIDVILIDDPIQSMDSINVLSTIDLLRSICLKFDKQLIISTHDENFFGLLQRKIPTQVFGSKFLELKKFGVVSPVDPLFN